MRLSRSSLFPRQAKKNSKIEAAPVAESWVEWQQLQLLSWAASVCNAQQLIVGNGNSIVTMEIVIS